MKFRLKGIEWEIRLALKRVESVKSELVTPDINDIYTYLQKYHRADKEEIKKIIGGRYEKDSNELG